jgi:BirA family biotin operon repressor/biotin-[acetyl-CoA-carboxylase] ligase
MQVQQSKTFYIHLNDVDSTNNYVANLVRSGSILSGTVVSADFQYNGRGQRATNWQSLKNQNALFSLFLKWNTFLATQQFQISMIAALSVVKSLEQIGLQKVEIKWPNDIFVDQHKIAGILIENDINGNQISTSIIGIGLNVNQVAFDAAMRATSLKLETGQVSDVQTVISKIVQNIMNMLEEFQKHENRMHELKKMYLSKLLGYQKKMHVLNLKTQSKSSIKTLDITQMGQLLASDEQNQLHIFDIKDITWLFD